MTSPIVIVGGGFAGLYTALELARRPGHPPLLLVEPRDRFVFLPFLYERLSGELPLWQMAPRYDALLAGHGIGWQRDRVAAVEPDSCHVVLESGQRLHYSQLVIATGAKPDSFGIPGVEDHALRFHSLEDVEALRAQLPTIRNRVAIVGAGPSGVELACKLADLLRGQASVELIERGERCLPQAKAFNRSQAELALQQRDVRLRCQCGVQAVQAGQLTLQDAQGQSSTLAVDAVVWTAGQRTALPAGALATDARGRLRCNASLQLESDSRIFSLGDTASVPHDPELPATAQVAFQQAQLLARNLLLARENQPLEEFKWKDLGEMLSLGVGDATLTGMGLTLAGSSAYQLRRWTYLTRLPGCRLPLQVAAGWLSAPRQ
ncbi:MAG: NAD(P)/FAD-dependent oxidoreductase [Synechococcus sp. H1_metabat_bins_2.tsv.006]|nr:NAD(P)/FAD-dependent oxidoreductase [Synechococcus sp. H1_metabat_bins_2.tsv.006]